MNDLFKGLGRAVAILLGILVVYNLMKPVIFKKSNVIIEDPNGFSSEENNDIRKMAYDNKHDYKTMYEKYNFELVQDIFGDEFIAYYYHNRPFNNDFYLFLSIANLTKNKFVLLCNNTLEFSYKEVSDVANSLFDNVILEKASYTTEDGNLSIDYDEETNRFIVKNKRCSGIGLNENYIETKYIGGIENNGVIEIYENAHLIERQEKNGLIKLTHHKGTYLDSPIVTNGNYSKFKMIFEMDGSSYYLVGIQEVE